MTISKRFCLWLSCFLRKTFCGFLARNYWYHRWMDESRGRGLLPNSGKVSANSTTGAKSWLSRLTVRVVKWGTHIPLTIHVRKFNRILRMTWMYHSSNPSSVLPLGYSLTVLLRSVYSLIDEIGSSCCVGWEKVEQSAIKFKGRGHTFNCPSGSYTSIYSIGLRLFIL